MFPRRRPPWWPEENAWPPSPPLATARWRHARGAFHWRLAAFFGFLLLAGGLSCAGLLWLAGILAGPEAAPRLAAWLLAGLGLLLVLALLQSIRSFALPLRDLVETAGRVEAGDLSARARERGPRELRGLARAINAMLRRLQATEAVRRNLLADVTHELRTPVSVIQGNLEALLDGVYPPDEAHLIPVLEETRLLSRLIDDLRTLSMAESGALDLHLELTDMGVLLSETAGTFRAVAGEAGVTLIHEIPSDLPLLEVDPLRIREVMDNLTANALRHTPRGGSVTLSAALASGPSRLSVSVADTGAGIPADRLPHIFDRFYKADNPGGRGLGLAIAKNLVEAHHGTIRAESTLGHGTVIRISLPRVPPD